MTYDTLLFLRQLCDRVTINVSDPDFRTIATSMIAAIDELDQAIRMEQMVNADSPGRAR